MPVYDFHYSIRDGEFSYDQHEYVFAKSQFTAYKMAV
jgi:hypothetical protein